MDNNDKNEEILKIVKDNKNSNRVAMLIAIVCGVIMIGMIFVTNYYNKDDSNKNSNSTSSENINKETKADPLSLISNVLNNKFKLYMNNVELIKEAEIERINDSEYNVVVNIKKNDNDYSDKYLIADDVFNLIITLKQKENIDGYINKYTVNYYNQEGTIQLIVIYDNSNTGKINVNNEDITKQEVKDYKEKKEKEEYKNKAKTYSYKVLARDPNKYKGEIVKFTGEVVQVVEGSGKTISLRVNVTKSGTYYTYYTDTIYVDYTYSENESKILENDIVTLYGEFNGDYTYTSVLNSSVTIPWLKAKYIELK